MADSKKATGGKRFSVYAGLGDSPEISWSTVASTLSEDLTSMRETKMKERAAIEKATNEQMEALNKLQDVNSRSLGRVVLEGSSQSKEELRLRMDLVRKGLLKPADYKLFMQEQKSGYSNFSNIVKTYDQWHTKAMEKINAGTATDAEIFVLKQIESFGNLNNKKIYTNPANGQIQVVTMEEDEDGKFTKMPSAKDSPNSFNNPGSMLDLMSYDGGVKKELRDEAKKITDSLATIITSSVRNGSVTKVSDFRQIFDDPASLKDFGITDEDITTFDQWLDSQVKTLTATDADMAQILSQRGYQYDDKDAPNYIELYIKGGQVVYKLTDDQKAKARQIAKNEINMQIDSEITKTPGFDPLRSNARGFEQEEDNKFGRVKAMNDILSADNSQDAINRIDTDPTYENVESMQMVDENGNNIDQKDWLKAKEIKIQYYDPNKGELTEGTVRLFDDKGDRKNSDKIVMDMVEKLGIPTEQLEAYKKAFLAKKGKFNSFKGIANYTRGASELTESGNVEVSLGKSKYPSSQAISNILKEDFKDDEQGVTLLSLKSKADEGEDSEEQKAADQKIDQYKWSQITNMINATFKPRLRGKSFEFNIQSDGNLQVIYNSKPINLGVSKEGLGNDGSKLIKLIEQKINEINFSKPPSGGGGELD